jgi:hypothetical protein
VKGIVQIHLEISTRIKPVFLGEIMKRSKSILAIFAFLAIIAGSTAISQQPPAEKPPANVAGNWTFYTKGDDGKTGTHYLQIIQNGNDLTGHFKGPNQSGGIQGTINLQHIVIKTKTFHVFTFRGRVEGDSIQGTCGIMGHHCTFQGVRTN